MNLEKEEMRDLFVGAIRRYEKTPFLVENGQLRYNRLLKAINRGQAFMKAFAEESDPKMQHCYQVMRQKIMMLNGDKMRYWKEYEVYTVKARYQEKYPELFKTTPNAKGEK